MQWTVIVFLQMKGITIETLQQTSVLLYFTLLWNLTTSITIETIQPTSVLLYFTLTLVLLYKLERLNDHLHHGNLQIFHINNKHLHLDGHCPFNIMVSFIF